jgi:hypothetical protein
MKRLLSFILFGSLVIITFWRLNPSRLPLRETKLGSPESHPIQPLLPARPQPVAASGTNLALREVWGLVESRDFTKLVANLRELGCPEQTIRDLVAFRICREYRKRLLEVETEFLVPLGYTKLFHAAQQQERIVKERELRVAMDNELETALGVSAEKLKADLMGWPSPTAGFLSLEKKRQVRDLKEKYERLIEAARQGLIPGDYDPATDARVKELEEQREVELAQVLTREELEESRMRSSPAARYVLEKLPEAGSEDEFRKMVGVVQEIGIEKTKTGGNPYDLPFLPSGFNANKGEDEGELSKKRAQLNARLKEVLGEQRFTEMQLAQKKPRAEGN